MLLRRVIAIAALAPCLALVQCSNAAPGGATVGVPCVPSLEKDPAFTGFKVTEETIETGAPDCGGGVCLVNHFQGRVSCPLGQPSTGGDGCQQEGADAKDNAGKGCCAPGGSEPATAAVCGQCAGQAEVSTRDADNAVYCSCRCGVADGAPDEPDYDFCTCPDGFECSEIRKNFGIGDTTLSGKYCIKLGTAYDPNKDQCGNVDGYWVSGGDQGVKCTGVGTGQCQTAGGPCN